MKKFFLLLSAILILPATTAQCNQNEWSSFAIGAITVVGAGYGLYHYYYRSTPITATNNEHSQNDVDKIRNINDKIISAHKEKDRERSKIIPQDTNNSQPSQHLETPLNTSPDNNTTKKPTPSESAEKPESSFMQKWLAYSADYRELHDENPGCFEN